MPVHTAEFRLSTSGNAEIVDITDRVQAAVAEAGVGEGQATAFVRGSTAAITTMEYEPGGVHDLQALLDRLIPVRGDYEHNRLNHDTNSHAHQRASIIGPSEAVPVQGRPPGAGHLAAAGRPDRLRRPPARADRPGPGNELTPSADLGGFVAHSATNPPSAPGYGPTGTLASSSSTAQREPSRASTTVTRSPS